MQEFEDGLLNRALWSRDVAEEAFTKVTVDDFTPGNAMQLAELITAAVDQTQPDRRRKRQADPGLRQR